MMRVSYPTLVTVLLAAAASPTLGAGHIAQSPSKALVTYSVEILPNPLGGPYAQGSSINNRSDVAGFGTLPDNKTMHAVLWRNGHRRDLGTLGGPNSAVAWPNRNDRGEVAGISETAQNNPKGETWSCAAAVFYIDNPTGKICVGFRWKNGKMTALPTLGGYNGFATGINNAGQIAGWAENTTEEPTCNAPQVYQFEAVVWDEGKKQPRVLPPYSGDLDGAATAINNSGQVVGISGICANAVGGASAKHMLLWDGNKVTNLGSLGGDFWNTPMDINEKGNVTGFSDLSGDSESKPNFNAFFWSKQKGLVQIMPLDGDTISEGLGINDRDQVVGVSYPSGHAFIWQDGVATDLNTLISAKSKVALVDAQAINDAGEITGEAQDATGVIYSFIARPK